MHVVLMTVDLILFIVRYRPVAECQWRAGAKALALLIWRFRSYWCLLSWGNQGDAAHNQRTRLYPTTYDARTPQPATTKLWPYKCSFPATHDATVSVAAGTRAKKPPRSRAGRDCTLLNTRRSSSSRSSSAAEGTSCTRYSTIC
jgi:hypothetical protein